MKAFRIPQSAGRYGWRSTANQSAIRHCDVMPCGGKRVEVMAVRLRAAAGMAEEPPGFIPWWSKIQDAAKSPVDFMHQAGRYLPDPISEIRLVQRDERRDVDD